VNKNLSIILLFFFIINCSFDKTTGIWTEDIKIEKEKKNKEKKSKIEKVFKKEKFFIKEFNPDLRINLSAKLVNNSFINNFDNNNGRINYDGNLKKKSKFKFSKIENFNRFEPEISFYKDNVIFFDNKGSILKFDEKSKLVWKKNNYTKVEKKLKPILFFANDQNNLIVADNIAKYYSININTGELLWSKNASSPFNSEIKIFKDKFFIIDFDNTLRCFSIKDGNQIWKVKTEQSFIKSDKKLSLVIVDNIVYFINSIGDVTAVDIKNGEIIWQTPTQSSLIIEDTFYLKNSELIANNDSILFSNNRNDFFSLDSKTGIINWKQKINSDLRPTLIDNLVFTITSEGFLVIIDNLSGNIIRSTDIFNIFKEKKRNKINPVGFIVGSQKIFLTTDHGRLIIINITDGKVLSILKIDNDKISRPFILNQNLFIIKENSIIKLD